MIPIKDELRYVTAIGVLGTLLLILLTIFAGIFIFIPFALCFITIAIIKYNKRKPIPTAELHDQLRPVFPEPHEYEGTFIDSMLKAFEGSYPPLPLFTTM